MKLQVIRYNQTLVQSRRELGDRGRLGQDNLAIYTERFSLLRNTQGNEHN